MKIVILGNAGSGKTTLARNLIARHGHAAGLLSLDQIAWDEDNQRKSQAESLKLLQAFVQEHPHWVIEGCYRDLVEAALPFCDQLIFLNPGIESCLRLAQRRAWEPDKFPSPEAQVAVVAELLEWIQQYESRSNEYGEPRHRKIFRQFQGPKEEFNDLENYPSGDA